MKEKQKANQARRIQRAKEKGQKYNTPDRIRNMDYAQRI